MPSACKRNHKPAKRAKRRTRDSNPQPVSRRLISSQVPNHSAILQIRPEHLTIMDHVFLRAELRALKQLSGSSKNTLQDLFCKARMAVAFHSQGANPLPADLDLASFFAVQPTGAS